MAKSSALRSGCSNGSRLMAVPSRMRDVSRATAVRKICGLGQMPNA